MLIIHSYADHSVDDNSACCFSQDASAERRVPGIPDTLPVPFWGKDSSLRYCLEIFNS